MPLAVTKFRFVWEPGRLGRFHVGKVLSAVDHPKLFVTTSEVKNLLVFGQDNQRRVAYLGVDSHHVLFAVLDNFGVRWNVRCGRL